MSEPVSNEIQASQPDGAWRHFRANRPAVLGALMLLVFSGLLLVWPIFASPRLASLLPAGLRHGPLSLSDDQFQPPGPTHWFGTDLHGRDLLSRVAHGARVSLLVGLVGAMVSLVIGVLWGVVAGYLGGLWDAVLMRLADVVYSLPSIIFIIILMTTFEPVAQRWLARFFPGDSSATARMLFLFVGLGAISWLSMARIVRGQVLSLRHRPFVEASRALGAGHARIILHHILPHVRGVVLVYLMLTVPSVILYESFLSYLGLGIQPPEASLGSLIAEGAAQINSIRTYWWMVLTPASALVGLLLALNLVAGGLKEALDPPA